MDAVERHLSDHQLLSVRAGSWSFSVQVLLFAQLKNQRVCSNITADTQCIFHVADSKG
jgi:hypothetical protein